MMHAREDDVIDGLKPVTEKRGELLLKLGDERDFFVCRVSLANSLVAFWQYTVSQSPYALPLTL